ncbi:universal stress protein [Secundilactobacillus malefermentans]|uniref:UspA domain-containing protein n=1 Tax=Secundilactobacillus malefermentans TaxID=176292 RepID=A0A4R5NPJ0_9LACO|nr:universal stress protein [Secundilactobacillus malefermentans]KRM55262.1 UspA family nucleotide-binding protein [Secundilactobacillus malefermentans DSM 5705 = KCTC 3548]QEA30788.1 universal stress protein [Secundilactobacillus malefermentans]TDG78391.1 hypothetical protein C5L31_001878 [Secundilactobacillus malefermentans]
MASIPYHKILVGVDGSKQARRAVIKAIASAKRNDAELIIATVISSDKVVGIGSTRVGFGYVDQSVLDGVKEEFENLVAKYKDMAVESGIKKVQTIVKFGNAKVEIASQLSTHYGVDLIILGATGSNVVERMMMGSTASYVVTNAICDVLIIRTNLDNKVLTKNPKFE